MARRTFLSRWIDRNQGKMLGLSMSAFATFIFSATAASIQSVEVIHAAQCRAPAYIGTGYFLAAVETADGRTFRIGSEHNAHDHAAKLEAHDLVQIICTGGAVSVGYFQANDFAMPEIIAARPIGG